MFRQLSTISSLKSLQKHVTARFRVVGGLNNRIKVMLLETVHYQLSKHTNNIPIPQALRATFDPKMGY
jgi:hypothetical protein